MTAEEVLDATCDALFPGSGELDREAAALKAKEADNGKSC